MQYETFFHFFIFMPFAALLLYFGWKFEGRLTAPWSALAAAMGMYAIAEFFSGTLGLAFDITSHLLLIVGAILLLMRRSLEVAELKARHKKLEAVLKKLRVKYFKQQLNEADARKLSADLQRQLAEIEVDLETRRR